MQGNGSGSANGSASGSPYMSAQQQNGSTDSLPPFSINSNARSSSPAISSGLSDAERMERHIARDNQSTPEQRFGNFSSLNSGNETLYSSNQSFSMNVGRQAPGHLQFSPHQLSTGPAALMSPQPGGPSKLPENFNAMSPQTARATMTPSMPGFSFHPFPQTPPLVPHFLSPGLGPFSPTLGSTGFGQPITGYNPAPGAPVHGS